MDYVTISSHLCFCNHFVKSTNKFLNFLISEILLQMKDDQIIFLMNYHKFIPPFSALSSNSLKRGKKYKMIYLMLNIPLIRFIYTRSCSVQIYMFNTNFRIRKNTLHAHWISRSLCSRKPGIDTFEVLKVNKGSHNVTMIRIELNRFCNY